MFDLYIIAEREKVLEVTNETKNLANLPIINIIDIVKVIYQIKSKISNFPILDPKLSNKTRSLVLRKERKLYSKIFKKLKFVISNQEFKAFFEEQEVFNNQSVSDDILWNTLYNPNSSFYNQLKRFLAYIFSEIDQNIILVGNR